MITIFDYGNEEFNYCVYYHRNLINNKLYIGISKDVTVRWRNDGGEYKTCKYFWRAIDKYGWCNFEHVVLIDNITKKEAEVIEKELIKKYKTQNKEFGYNIAAGGTGGCTVKGKDHASSKTVYQYDLDGNYIREWENAQRASEELGVSVSDIHINCRKGNGVKRAGNFMWSYEKVPCMEKYIRKGICCEPIIQMDKDFNIVQRYEDIRYVDGSIYKKQYVTRCCIRNRITYKEYYWVYEKDMDTFQDYLKERINAPKKKPENPVKWKNTKHIYQCDLNKNILQEFRTAKEVQELTGFNRNSVQLYCKRPEHNHGKSTGYYWVYVDEYEDFLKE